MATAERGKELPLIITADHSHALCQLMAFLHTFNTADASLEFPQQRPAYNNVATWVFGTALKCVVTSPPGHSPPERK